jgi:O-Antigen ligase
LIALPLIFVAWRRRRVLPNVLFVLVPSAVMLWAVYLTHSRGALLALAVLAVIVARKRIGTPASVVLTTLLILGMLALDFTGGRAISAVEGADRLESWATGLEMFKSAPLFGIGFGGYTDYNEITAHNSLVLCLAELGLVGATLWVALLVTTMTGLNKIIGQQRKGQTQSSHTKREAAQGTTACAEATLSADKSHTGAAITVLTAADSEPVTRRAPAFQGAVPPHWVMAMRLALVAFMVTGWFLSRGYDTPLFLVLGLATATITLQGNAATWRARSRWLPHTLAVETAAIIFIYGIVRLRS